MFIIMKSLSSLIATAAFVVTNNKTANAGALPHLSEDSLDSRDAEAELSVHQKTDLNTFVPDEANNSIGTTYDSIISMIKPNILDEVLPNSASMLGCVRAKDSEELYRLIVAADPGGEVRLCPGKVEFNSPIELTKSITIACAGPKFSCIFDGNGANNHLYNSISGLAYAFSGIAFINGFSGEGSCGYGGSVWFGASVSSLFDRCLFYNNRAKFSYGPRGGAISANGGTTVVNNCVFLANVATSESDQEAYGGAIYVNQGNLRVLDCTFKKNIALQDDPPTYGGGGAIYMYALFTNIDLLVAGSVFELNEASNEGGVALIDEANVGKVKVGWINNNELLFGNTDNDGCDGVLVKRSYDDTASTCASVGDNFFV
eukprot:CAMPEP_0181099396 /NCGR_PEP_ID=MMETSP1071-20121207/12638_1 /TAXON_ID=35127 /ORGANISM="Thalassiosira sp., Strain NH16" /LENGTH=372 /DNA_ID=CAMNT_0023182057 /DNA_START=232 /DNA_END=1350 /DNA_ORIENTATION=+